VVQSREYLRNNLSQSQKEQLYIGCCYCPRKCVCSKDEKKLKAYKLAAEERTRKQQLSGLQKDIVSFHQLKIELQKLDNSDMSSSRRLLAKSVLRESYFSRIFPSYTAPRGDDLALSGFRKMLTRFKMPAKTALETILRNRYSHFSGTRRLFVDVQNQVFTGPRPKVGSHLVVVYSMYEKEERDEFVSPEIDRLIL
jgi:hypothetical protein